MAFCVTGSLMSYYSCLFWGGTTRTLVSSVALVLEIEFELAGGGRAAYSPPPNMGKTIEGEELLECWKLSLHR